VTPRSSPLATWARFVFRHRRSVLVAAMVVLAGTAALVLAGGTLSLSLQTNGPARRAADLVHQQIPQPGASSFQVVFRSSSDRARSAAFRSAVDSALKPIRSDGRVTSVVTPYDAATPSPDAAISQDGHAAFVTVYLRDGFQKATAYYAGIRSSIHSDRLTVLAAGDLAVNQNLDQSLDADLAQAEKFSLPISLALLLVVFGTVVAALLPLGVGVMAIVGGAASTLLVARGTDVSDLAVSLVTLLGLGLAIDYSLFIVSRFREELAGGASVEAALETSLATAGRAVAFSGMAVVVGLAGLLFFQGSFLPSMGAAAALVVAFAVFYALTFLPALLAILGHRVDRLRVIRGPSGGRGRFWHALAGGIMRRPWVLVPAVAVLLLAGVPFLHLRFESSDLKLLPAQTEARRAQQVLVSEFPEQGYSHIEVVVRFPGQDPLSSENVGALYDLSRSIAAQPGVLRVDGVVDVQAGLDRAAYQSLYANRQSLPAPLQQVVHETVGRDLIVLDAVSTYDPQSEQARGLVRRIRSLPHEQGQLLVTGTTAVELDIVDLITRVTPWAGGFVVGVMYLVLLALLRSVLLPVKAVVMTILSISASFGALVWIFQDGHLSSQLGFTPSALDPAVPVLLFCMVFGLSMDYEVLLLSRMQEAYVATRDNATAVGLGLERSGRLITGAAAIMVAVFASFAIGSVVLVKAVGLGMAIAVALDATIVRCVAVPAVMRLLGRVNWWAPGPLRHPQLAGDDVPGPVTAAPSGGPGTGASR
jgi:putative drug exporter of the RND superfamily